MSSAAPTIAAGVSAAPARARGSLQVAEGVPEALKWIALVLMSADHVNKFLFSERLPYVFEAGRTSMPLFAFVLAYNLARPGALESGAYERTLSRLLVWGLISSPAFFLLVGWWPLNIMFMLATGTAVCWLVEQGGKQNLAVAAFLFLLAGAFVEFWWPALVLFVAAWAYCKKPTPIRMAVVVLGIVALWGINRNYWAMASLPLVWLVLKLRLRVPGRRFARFFYAFYPTHLFVLYLAREYFTS